MDDQDPRTEGLICGVTKQTQRHEWICIKPPHADVYTRKTKNQRRGDLVFSNNPKADKHHFINRWPNRTEENDYGNEEAEASGRTG